MSEEDVESYDEGSNLKLKVDGDNHQQQKEKLEEIRKEVEEAKNEIWWLSTFLVKLPLVTGCIWLILLLLRGRTAKLGQINSNDLMSLAFLVLATGIIIGGMVLIRKRFRDHNKED